MKIRTVLAVRIFNIFRVKLLIYGKIYDIIVIVKQINFIKEEVFVYDSERGTC